MKLSRIGAALAVAAVAGWFSVSTLRAADASSAAMWKPSRPNAKTFKKPAAPPATIVKYVCPMGEYTGAKPGKCPKCGMELKRVVEPAPKKPATKK